MSMSLAGLIRSDLERYRQTHKLRRQAYSGWRAAFESFVFKAGFQAVFLYRLSHWLYRKRCVGLAWLVARLNVTITGAEIEFNAEIGPGIFIAHSVGIVIGRGTKIGSGVTLFQGASFGVKSWRADEIRKFPKVGDNCFFFAHSVILGDIVIGDNCVVAAQAVVSRDMPDGSLAAGVPAEIYAEKGKELIYSWSV